jgi:hypothetical protein
VRERKVGDKAGNTLFKFFSKRQWETISMFIVKKSLRLRPRGQI